MTFDDGLKSSFEFIMSELTPRNIRVIVFVPTIILRNEPEEQLQLALRRRFPGLEHLREEQYLSINPDEIHQLTRAGHWVMPHSHTHARLSLLRTEQQFYEEIEKPKQILEAIVEGTADVFAFPYGDMTALSRQAYEWIRRTYRYCFTAIGGPTTPHVNELLLRRDNVDQSFDFILVEAKLDGVFDSYSGLKDWRLRRRLES